MFGKLERIEYNYYGYHFIDCKYGGENSEKRNRIVQERRTDFEYYMEYRRKWRKAICKDVVTILKDKYGLDFAVTTVYTFLNNLVKKGYVKNENEGINFYISTKSKDEYIKSVLKRINELFFNGNKENLIKTIKSIDAGLLQ